MVILVIKYLIIFNLNDIFNKLLFILTIIVFTNFLEWLVRVGDEVNFLVMIISIYKMMVIEFSILEIVDLIWGGNLVLFLRSDDGIFFFFVWMEIDFGCYELNDCLIGRLNYWRVFLEKWDHFVMGLKFKNLLYFNFD